MTTGRPLRVRPSWRFRSGELVEGAWFWSCVPCLSEFVILDGIASGYLDTIGQAIDAALAHWIHCRHARRFTQDLAQALNREPPSFRRLYLAPGLVVLACDICGIAVSHAASHLAAHLALSE